MKDEVTTGEITEDPVEFDYANADLSDVDETGKLRNFEQFLKKPEEQEKTEEQKTETDNNTSEEENENLEVDSANVEEETFSPDDFGSIEKHMKFLSKGLDDVVEMPGTKKEETITPITPEQKVEEKEELTYSQKFLNDLAPINNVYNQIMQRHNGNWDTAQPEIQDFFERQARDAENEDRINKGLEELKKERAKLAEAKEVEASRPQYNQNMYEVARQSGWKDSKQLHDFMYDGKGGGEFMMFLFNMSNPKAKFLGTEDFKQKWDNFNIEFGSNKQNLQFAEKMMRTIYLSKSYTKAVSKGVAKKLKQQKDKDRGFLNSNTTKNATIKTTSKMSEAQRWINS